MVAIERTGIYRGLYHVLHGRIAPLEGMNREDIYFDELLDRVRIEPVDEVIIATNPNLEGEATAFHLQRALAPLGVRVTRLARGLPTGGDLEWADPGTLGSALEGRRENVIAYETDRLSSDGSATIQIWPGLNAISLPEASRNNRRLSGESLRHVTSRSTPSKNTRARPLPITFCSIRPLSSPGIGASGTSMTTTFFTRNCCPVTASIAGLPRRRRR